MTGLRDALLADGRKSSSVNKIMTHATSIIGWAVATGLIDRNYATKLTIIKGARSVPLLGIPEDHLEKLSQTQGRLFSQSKSGFDQLTNKMIRDLLGTNTPEGLSFHSLRHSLSFAVMSVEIAKAIMGHSSGSITFDLYGATRLPQ